MPHMSISAKVLRKSSKCPFLLKNFIYPDLKKKLKNKVLRKCATKLSCYAHVPRVLSMVTIFAFLKKPEGKVISAKVLAKFLKSKWMEKTTFEASSNV